MEDTYIAKSKFYKNMDMYAVFDGHAGSFVSEFLAREATSTLIQAFENNKGRSIEDTMFIAINTLHTELKKYEQSKNTGSTALIAIRNGMYWYIANIGDCRAITNVNATAVPLTKDHKPIRPKEYQRITSMPKGFVTNYPMDVPRVNGMLAVSRSLGDLYLSPYVRWEPEVSLVKQKPESYLFVLASDGLWDTMSDQDVVDVYMQGIHVQGKGKVTSQVLGKCTEEVITQAIARGSQDNITVIAVVHPYINESLPPTLVHA